MTAATLQATVVAYLESNGWYFDLERAANFDWIDEGDRVREAPAWTVPQWAEYWSAPFADDQTHKNYGKPKTRRHESLKDALWSQLLREEKPAQFAAFFEE